MTATDRIAERLPQFYKTWTKDSLISKVLHSFGNPIDEAEDELFRIMRAHWIDNARGIDLDHLGSIFHLRRSRGETDKAFRSRIKRAIQEFKGGGTIPSLESALKALFGPLGNEVQLTEFPPTPFSVAIQASSGDTWNLKSEGIEDATPTVRLTLETQGEIQDPKLTSKASGDFMGFHGSMKTGEELFLSNKRCTLNGADAAKKMAKSDKGFMVQRAGSDWQYTESLHSKIGVFDTAVFDESIFSTALAKVRIRFDWVAKKTATINVQISRAALERAGQTEEEVKRILNALKGAGIDVQVRIVEPSKIQPPALKPPITIPVPEPVPVKPLTPEEVKEIIA